MFGLDTTALVFSNEGLNDIMKLVKPLADAGLLIKGLVKEFKINPKNKKVDFLTCY